MIDIKALRKTLSGLGIKQGMKDRNSSELNSIVTNTKAVLALETDETLTSLLQELIGNLEAYTTLVAQREA